MPTEAATVTSYKLADYREEIDSRVYMVRADDRPMTQIVGSPIKSEHRAPTYYLDDRRQPGTNRVVEGETGSVLKAQPSRVERRVVHQQLGDGYKTSDIADIVNRADYKQTSMIERTKVRMSILDDFELAASQNQAPVIGIDGNGGAGTGAAMAGAECFFDTNTNRGTGGADGAWNAGTRLFQAPTDAVVGNRRPLTDTMLMNIQQQVYNAGKGKVGIALMSGLQKLKFDALTGNIQKQQNVSSRQDESLVHKTSVDFYETSFGTFQAKPSRFVRDHVIMGFDEDYWKRLELQPLTSKDKPTGTFVQEEEIKMAGCIKCTHEASSWLIADLTF